MLPIQFQALMMEDNKDSSTLNKIIKCKPRGLKQYKKRLALTGESRYHPFKSNTKPKVCLTDRKRDQNATSSKVSGNIALNVL